MVLFLSVMVVCTLLQVFLRALATHAGISWANTLLAHIAWTDPLSRALMLWLTFLGASLLARRNRHIRIDVASTVLPRAAAAPRETLLALVTAFICCVMALASFHMVQMERSYGGRVFLDIPTWIVQIILPLGFLLLAFRFALNALERLRPAERRE